MEGLHRFPNLAYLDLSSTLAARDKNVLWTLGDLPFLQVLKLRSVHLRDGDVQILAEAIGLKVRSLDVQDNHLTDHSVRSLLTSCFKAGDAIDTTSNGRPRAVSNLAVEDWPSGFVRPDPAILDEFRDESYDERFVRRLTSGNVSRLPYEDMPHSGITHLYIANNNLMVEGVAALIRAGKLHVLDAGSVDESIHASSLEAPPLLSTSDPRRIPLPGVEKLTPILSRFAHDMTSLRIHHAVVTKHVPLKDESSPVVPFELSTGVVKHEMDGSELSEMDATACELDATPPIYELEEQDPQPRYELPGDTTHFYVSPPVGDKPTLSKEESQPEARRGSIFAPESLEPEEPDEDTAPVLTATGLGLVAQAVNGVNTTSQAVSVADTDHIDTGRESAQLRTALIEKQRKDFRISRLDKPHGLVPGMLPKLRTLTLTNVPAFDSTGRIVDALKQFINDCAFEAELADLQARLETGPAREPGYRHAKQNRHTAREIFALRHITLEMAPSTIPLTPRSTSSKFSSSSSNHRTKSSTEDADTEALWSAAANDFTFFDKDEECGLPSVDTDPYVPESALSEKMTTISTDVSSPQPDNTNLPIPKNRPTTTGPPLPPKNATVPLDVVKELSQFRKERKTAYESAVVQGLGHVDGYWPGDVKVVRGQQHHHTGTSTGTGGGGGKVDYYGNRFEEQGGVYR